MEKPFINFNIDNYEELDNLSRDEWGDHELNGGTLFRRENNFYQYPPIWSDHKDQYFKPEFLAVLGIEMFTDRCDCVVKKADKCRMLLILTVWKN